MENIYAMLARVNFLYEVRENERKAAAKVLHHEIEAFTANYGYACTDECPCTKCTYVLMRDGLILRKAGKDEEEVGETIEIETLSIEEMEFLKRFMVDTINNDIQYQEDEIDKYIDLYR